MHFSSENLQISPKEIQDGWVLLLIHTEDKTSRRALRTLVAKKHRTDHSKVLLRNLIL